MSTYWHFECLDHDPPLQSVDEFTQHTEDAAFWAGVKLALSRPLPPNMTSVDYFTRNAYSFLVQHPTCSVGLINEYGVRRPLPEETP